MSTATPDDDAGLIAACRAGDARAWERLVLRFERLIYTIARRAGLGADDAADVFQTAFMRLHQHLDTLAQPERVQAWLVTTARRETLRLLREGRRTVSLTEPGDGGDDAEPGAEADIPDPDPLPEALLEQLQLHHVVRVAFERLPEPCRSLVDMLYGREEPVPYAEVSARLGLPAGSIGPMRARCLAKLRRLTEQAGAAPRSQVT